MPSQWTRHLRQPTELVISISLSSFLIKYDLDLVDETGILEMAPVEKSSDDMKAAAQASISQRASAELENNQDSNIQEKPNKHDAETQIGSPKENEIDDEEWSLVPEPGEQSGGVIRRKPTGSIHFDISFSRGKRKRTLFSYDKKTYD